MEAPVVGPVKAGRRTKELISRLKPGDIAVIDHDDLDEVAARSLIRSKVKAVINAGDSLTGTYPAPGAKWLLEAGIVLVDRVDEDVFLSAEADCARGATEWRIEGARLYGPDGWIGEGHRWTSDSVAAMMRQAHDNLQSHLEAFVLNTLAYAARERDFILGTVTFPPLRTVVKGRPAVVVVRGPGYVDDLKAISSYIDEVNPLLVAVDGGADALLEMGRRPHVIIGDMDSVSDRALLSGAELIVHAYTDGRAPGLTRVSHLGGDAHVVSSPGTSEDVALLMLYDMGAKVIVAVGTHSNIVDFFEKGRKGMASTFLVRLKVGSILVDAKGLNQIYRGAPKRSYPWVILTAALVPVALITATAPALSGWLKAAWLYFRLWTGW